MMERKTFECLRCEHGFETDYDPKRIVERACPKCGSNSVRPAPLVKAGAETEKVQSNRRSRHAAD